MDDLTYGAKTQMRAKLERYSEKSRSKLTLDDLVLPDEEMTQVEEILAACRNKSAVLNEWGFRKKLVTGMGLCILFTGEPGTGKTLCAEILASELGMNLFIVSIPRVMSKWVGETEKNIEQLFSHARAHHSILLFDEADAMFTTRVKVERAVDRFSNMEVNYLLQEIERFEGIVVLTTNLETSIDRAFSRRIQFKLNFPKPDARQRTEIWKMLLPPEAPVDENINFDKLGEEFELAGGHIKNIIVRAAYQAKAEGVPIAMKQLLRAAELECKSAGKVYRVSRPSNPVT